MIKQFNEYSDEINEREEDIIDFLIIKSYGPTFGGNHDLYISNNCLNNNSSYSCLGNAYSDILGKGYSIFSGNINSGNFKLREIEVFKLFN